MRRALYLTALVVCLACAGQALADGTEVVDPTDQPAEVYLGLAQRASAAGDAMGLTVAAMALRGRAAEGLLDVEGGSKVGADELFAQALRLARSSADRPLERRIMRIQQTVPRGLVAPIRGALRDLDAGETLRFGVIARSGERALLRVTAPGGVLNLRITDEDGRAACTVERSRGQADCEWVPSTTARYTVTITHETPGTLRLVLVSN